MSSASPNLFDRVLVGLIVAYRYTLSPAFSALGARCRHAPSCSAYAIDAVRLHGAWAGAWMTLARLQRCHPWGTHGHDPAPQSPPPDARWWAPWRYGDWRGPEKPQVDAADKSERI